jgi:hypothetical protein
MPDPSTVVFGKLLLVGLGRDGAYILSQIAQELRHNFPENSSLKENIAMVAIGVRELGSLPKDLDEDIISVEMDTNLEYFRDLVMHGPGLPAYLDWWKEAGMPASGRGLARLAFFDQFRNGDVKSLLHQVLITEPRKKEISNYFILTSLSDVVGSSIMWDVIHFIERNGGWKEHGGALSSSVLWLAMNGQDNSEDAAPYAWRELERLGNGGPVNEPLTQYDIAFNTGYVTNGLDKIIVLNDAQENLSQIQDAPDCSRYMADIISLILTPSFNQYFIKNWVPSKGMKNDLGLSFGTISKVTFFMPSDLIINICSLRLIRSLFWDGLPRDNIPGIFDTSASVIKDPRFSSHQFLGEILSGVENPLSPTRMNSSYGGAVGSWSSLDINRKADFRDRLIKKLETILNGDSHDRDQQRKALAGKLGAAIAFLDSLLEELRTRSLKDYAEVTKAFRNELSTWEKFAIIKKDRPNLQSDHLQSIIDDLLLSTRSELRKVFQRKDRHQLFIKPEVNETQWEDEIYQAWLDYYLKLEKPGLFDPLSKLLDCLKWLPDTGDGSSFLIGLATAQKDIADNKFNSFELPVLVDQLINLVHLNLNKREAVFPEGLEALLKKRYKPNDILQAIEDGANPWMGEGNSVNSLHVIGADGDAVSLIADFLQSSGRNPDERIDSSVNPNEISILSIRDKVDPANIFRRQVRTPQKAKFTHSAEIAFQEMEQKLLFKDHDLASALSRQFTFFLSDPALARLFGLGLLLRFITYGSGGFVFSSPVGNFSFGTEDNRLLYYREHPVLAAMEDFVIEQPGHADTHHPLHPKNIRTTFEYCEEMLKNKENRRRIQLQKRFEEIIEYSRKTKTYPGITKTFEIWLSNLKSSMLEKN